MEKDPVRVQNVTCGLTNGQLLLCSINVLYEYKPKKTRIQRRSSSDWKHCLFLFRGVGHSCHFYFIMFYYSFRYGITWVLCFGCTVSQHRNIKIKLTVFTASRKTKGPSLILSGAFIETDFLSVFLAETMSESTQDMLVKASMREEDALRPLASKEMHEQLTSMEVEAQKWENRHTVLIVFPCVSETVILNPDLLVFWSSNENTCSCSVL